MQHYIYKAGFSAASRRHCSQPKSGNSEKSFPFHSTNVHHSARVGTCTRGEGVTDTVLKDSFRQRNNAVSKTTTREGVTGGRRERWGCCLSGCPRKTSWGKDTRAEASGERTRLGPWRGTTQACDKLPVASGSPTP